MTSSTLALIQDPGPKVRVGSRPGHIRELNWGRSWQHGTPAYWIDATRDAVAEGRIGSGLSRHRLGTDIRQEAAACILGGWGMPYEIGIAAFNRVREHMIKYSDPTPDPGVLLELLSDPLLVRGRQVRYRFAQQRSVRLAAALAFLGSRSAPTEHAELRNWLTQAPGIGLKTASWIVRNHFASDEVAVLDVHIVRTGIKSGIFPHDANPARNYEILEDLFLSWAQRGDVRASDLDAVIWAEQAFWARNPKRVVNSD